MGQIIQVFQCDNETKQKLQVLSSTFGGGNGRKSTREGFSPSNFLSTITEDDKCDTLGEPWDLEGKVTYRIIIITTVMYHTWITKKSQEIYIDYLRFMGSYEVSTKKKMALIKNMISIS